MWAPQEVQTFLDASLSGAAGQYGPLFAFLLASGCRVGEALGLRWADIDWQSQQVRVERQVTFVGSRAVELPPKTRAGVRTLTLPAWGITALKRQRAQSAAWKLSEGDHWQGRESVFTTQTGAVPNPPTLRRSFRGVCRRLGLQALRIHDLRHLHLSLLAMAGVPVKVAQTRVGHATPLLTLQVYTHVLGDADKQAADALERALA